MELFFDQPKETSNRFYRIPLWIIAFVAVADFPNENWYESKIKECFAGFCEVAETDKACLTRDDFSPLQLLLEVNEHLEIPYDVKITAKPHTPKPHVARVVPRTLARSRGIAAMCTRAPTELPRAILGVRALEMPHARPKP